MDAQGNASSSPAIDAVPHDPEKASSSGLSASNPPEASPAPPRTNVPVSKAREMALVFLVCNVQLVVLSGLGQAMAIELVIAEWFHQADPAGIAWYSAAFSLTVGTFILVMGRLGDMYGHKRLFVAGHVWLSLWSLVAGLAAYSRSVIFFDFCRAMQGLGGAILLPNALAILGLFYPQGNSKNAAFALFGAVAPSGFVLGAVFSSLVATLAWWPWAFWLSAIYAAVMAAAAAVIIPSAIETHRAAGGAPEMSFDWQGALTGVAGLVLFNVAWNQAPAVGWSDPYVLVFLIVSVLLFGVFFWVERRAAAPLVPLDALSGNAGLVLACIAFGWGSFGIWIYYLWAWTEQLELHSPLATSAQVVPAVVAGLMASAVVGLTVQKVRTAWLMLGAMLAFFAGNLIMATLEPGRLYWKQKFWTLVVTPFGMDISFPAAALILSNFVSHRHQGIAASLLTTVVNYSIAFGLGIAGTVEVHVNPTGTDLQKGFRGAYYAAVGLSGCGVLVALYFVLRDFLVSGPESKVQEKPASISSDPMVKASSRKGEEGSNSS